MEHFTVDHMCKHIGCEMAIKFSFLESMHGTERSRQQPCKPQVNTRCPTPKRTSTIISSKTLFLLLALQLLLDLAASLDALQDALTVLVELELGDDDFGGVNADGHGLARGLFADDALDVDYVFETVDGGDFAFAAFVGAADDGDFVVFSDGD